MEDISNYIAFPDRHRLDPANTALIVVDMQNDFLELDGPLSITGGRSAIPPNERILEFSRRAGIVVIFTVNVHRADGSDQGRWRQLIPAIGEGRALLDGTRGAEVCIELQPGSHEAIVKKHRHSAFFGTDLDVILRGHRIETVLVTGLATGSCVLSTARDAFARDYRTIVLADACAAGGYPDRGWGDITGSEIHRAALTIMAATTCEVMTVDECINLVSSEVLG